MDNGEYTPIDDDLIKGFDDIPEDKIIDVDSTSMEDLVGSVIILMGFTTKESTMSKGTYLCIEAEFNGEKILINTGSEAVTLQCEAYRPFFPLKVKVGKTGRKYFLEKA